MQMEIEVHEEDMEVEEASPTATIKFNNNNKQLIILNKNPTPVHTNRPHPLPFPNATYKECLKNHAVAVGGHALDGCGEFMPAGPHGSLDALKCAACNCHRNFHRKLAIMEDGYGDRESPSALISSYWRGPAPSPAGYLHVAVPKTKNNNKKKRVRTKFTEEQKEKMLRMAEKLEWQIHKNDEGAVLEFCNEIGVKRRVLKVWMHNNKNAFRKELPS